MPIAKPLEFCAHLAAAVRAGKKTITYKPLSVADLKRRAQGFKGTGSPYQPGVVVGVVEPVGQVHGKRVFASSFPEGAPPVGFISTGQWGTEISVTILDCKIVRLSTVTEAEAVLAGIAAPPSSTARAEFERQWRGAYHGPQGWDEDPLCWRVAFEIRAARAAK
jgi:hypothetical protein